MVMNEGAKGYKRSFKFGHFVCLDSKFHYLSTMTPFHSEKRLPGGHSPFLDLDNL